MAVTPQGGFGLVVKLNSGSLTTIANVIDADYPKFKKFIEESTGHDAASGYYQATASGKRRLEPFRVTVAYDKADTQHAYFMTTFNAETAIGWSIADPDGDETIAFNAYIEEILRISKQEETYKAELLVHPTGAPTIT